MRTHTLVFSLAARLRRLMWRPDTGWNRSMAAGLDAHNGILASEDLVSLHNRSRQAAVALYRKLAIGGYQKEFDDELEVAALVSFAIRNTRDFVLSPSQCLHARASSWNSIRL